MPLQMRKLVGVPFSRLRNPYQTQTNFNALIYFSHRRQVYFTKTIFEALLIDGFDLVQQHG